jgi:polar amino acid transport system substrate-binding protein
VKRILLAICYLLCSVKIYAAPQLIVSTAEESPIQEVSIQVLQEAYAEIGYKLHILRTANARSLMMANEGRTDGEVSRIRDMDDEFTNLVRVPVAVNKLDIRAFTKNPAIKISGWEDLRGYNLICVNGAKLVERNLAARNIDCYYVTQFSQAVHMLHAGRADIAIMPEVNGMHAIKQKGLTGIVMSDNSLHTAGLYHYLHKKHMTLIPKIESALKRMRERGRIKAIRADYLKSQVVNND